jgi:flagellar FliJ protein
MARFIFKLEGVLRQRKHVEQEKQRELAAKQTHLVELQNTLQGMQQSVAGSNDDVRKNRLVGRLDMAFLAAHRRFLAGMQRQALGVMQRIVLAQRAVDEARAQLAEAAKQRKIIEKLREQQFERWKADQAKRELAQLDEIGMQLAYQNLTDGQSPDTRNARASS